MTAPTPTVTVTVTRINTTRQVLLDIADGPVLTKQYGKRKFRVDRVVITYHQTGETGDWRWAYLDLSGPYVKADGTDGVDRNNDGFYTMQQVAERGFWSLVEQHTPGAAL